MKRVFIWLFGSFAVLVFVYFLISKLQADARRNRLFPEPDEKISADLKFVWKQTSEALSLIFVPRGLIKSASAGKSLWRGEVYHCAFWINDTFSPACLWMRIKATETAALNFNLCIRFRHNN